jgi:hypothetical protein
MAETITRTVQPYFVLEGNVCALLAAKDHVHLFLYDGAIVADPEEAARMISFYEGDTIKARPLSVMLKQIIANNRERGALSDSNRRPPPSHTRLQPAFPERFPDRCFVASQGESVDKKLPSRGHFLSGSDGTRTRDLRRDRPAF